MNAILYGVSTNHAHGFVDVFVLISSKVMVVQVGASTLDHQSQL